MKVTWIALRLLLDTEAVFKLAVYPGEAPPTLVDWVADEETETYLSVVTPWEMAIKAATGKVRLDKPASALIEEVLVQLAATILPIVPRHVAALEGLPLIHKDPFERMLVAQAIAEGLTIATSDEMIRSYLVPTIW